MKRIPAAFQSIIDYWQHNGMHVENVRWTSKLCRHVQADVVLVGVPGFAKLAIAHQRDQDEPDLIAGLRREAWWSRVIHALEQKDSSFPLTSPSMIYTHLSEPFPEGVAWVVMSRVEGVPLTDLIPPYPRSLQETEYTQFAELLDKVAKCFIALEKVRETDLQALGVRPLESPPHGMRKLKKWGRLDMNTAMLCNGAFELKNFYLMDNGKLAIIDNEFAGWYPPYDQLAYFYHRLACNQMRPDLAQRALEQYVRRTILTEPWGNIAQRTNEALRGFAHALLPHLVSGWVNDLRRRWVPPWRKEQRLRYRIGANILLRRYGTL